MMIDSGTTTLFPIFLSLLLTAALSEARADGFAKWPGNGKQVKEGKSSKLNSVKPAGAQVKNQDSSKLAEEQFPEKSLPGKAISIQAQGVDIINIDIQTNSPLHTVNDNFISYTLDFSDLTAHIPWEKFLVAPTRLKTLLQGLAPSILRIGGPLADSSFFDIKEKNLVAVEPKAVVLSKNVLLSLAQIAESVGARLLVGLGIQHRFGSKWNPGDAIAIMEVLSSNRSGAQIDFELGNEPELFGQMGFLKLSPEQIAEDFLALNRLVRSYPKFSTSQIVGPDCFDISKGSLLGYTILEATAKTAGHVLDAITFHHYYLNKETVTTEDLIDPSHFSSLAATIRNVKSAVSSNKKKELPLWLGETSHTRNSGTPGVTDRFVSGFLWLDKLGLAARMGVGVVMRQTIYGGFDSLLTDAIQPNPDYWLTLLYKELVGSKVLDVAIDGVSFTEEQASDSTAELSTTRVYAHCARPGNDEDSSKWITPTYPPGTVTIYAINVNPTLSKSIFLPAKWNQTANSDIYLMTPPNGDVLSDKILVNNIVMKLKKGDTDLPTFKPKPLAPGKPFVLPPLSFGFLVVPSVADACH